LEKASPARDAGGVMLDKVRHESRPLELDMDELTAALRSVDAIEYAYLFGSRARDKARPDSDVDLALGLTGGRDLELLGPLHDRILEVLDPLVPGERLDLVVLTERTPVALRQQVFRHGKLLFERAREHLVRLRALTAREWCDAEPRRREAWAITKRRILERAWSTGK
jgi:predicted nucleotidyltransferase